MTAERGYPDDRWYAEERGGYGEPEWADRRGGYGAPDQRFPDEPPMRPGGGDARYASLAELSTEMERRRGDRLTPEHRAPEPPRGPLDQPHREEFREDYRESQREPARMAEDDRASLHRAAQGPTRMTAEPAPDGVYRSKRPAVAVGLGLGVGVLEIAMLRVFLTGLFSSPLIAGRVIAGGLMILALPLLGLGLYGLATGAARAVDMWGPRVWLRPPLAYLTVSLALILAAGAAAS